MPARRTLRLTASRAARLLLAGWLVALAGCANGRFSLPRIDPTGERIFVHDPPAVVSPPVITAPPDMSVVPPGMVPGAPAVPVPPGAAPPALPADPSGALLVPQTGVSLTPSQVVAPVGSEVIMIATIANADGAGAPRERVEWTIAQGGVGEFLSPGERSSLDLLNRFRGLPQKVNSAYVVNSTVSHPTVLDRGTPVPTDDIPIARGQAWVTVSSPLEGTSYVTAYAPNVAAWDRRQQSGTIYWIDAQWAFPPPAIQPAGAQHAVTTTVTRQTDGSPLPGWIVRYEITGGPDAGFAPDGSPIVEITTSEAGLATAEVMQKTSSPGTNPISIQVIRPAGPTGPGKRITVGSGSTTLTWTSDSASSPGSAPGSGTTSNIAVRTTGPSQAGVGAVVTYRIEVSNPSSVAARDIVVTDQAPAGLSFLNSNPAANSSATGQEWRLGDLPGNEARSIEVNFRVEQPGGFNYCASAATADGNSARSCATTAVGAGQLDVAVRGPAAAEVGTNATFSIEVSNRGESPITGIMVSDRFDAGFEHSAASSPIETEMQDIAPRQSRRIEVTFRVAQAGQLCQQVTVTAAGGLRGETRNCITAFARAAQPGANVPSLTPTPAIPPGNTPRPAQPTTPRETPGGAPSTTTPSTATPSTAGPGRLSVRVQAPERRELNQIAEFIIQVTNTGDSPLTNVVISNVFETSLEPRQASENPPPQFRGGALEWTLPSIDPGRTETRQVNFLCLKESTRACNRVNVTAEGVAPAADEACLEIIAPPDAAPSGGKLSLSIQDTDDPIHVDDETTCIITLTNEGPGPAKHVVLRVTASPEMVITEVRASPVRGTLFSRLISFSAIAEVRKGESINFELRVRGDRAGTGKLHAEVTSDQQRQPITADETTQISN